MLADRIRQAVKTKGWTLRELERRSGVPYDTIYNVVHGRRQDPRFSVVAKLARALEISLDGLAEDPTPAPSTTGPDNSTRSPTRRRRPARGTADA
jgi:transcriptional regulator with XRE-family HTH domain